VNTPALTSEDRDFVKRAVEASIRVGVLALIAIWALAILRPFVDLVLWSIILSVAIYPLYARLARRVGSRHKLAATLITLVALAILLVPAWMFFGASIEEARQVAAQAEAGTLRVPPPPDGVRDWPLIGERWHAFWSQASRDLEATLERIQPELQALGTWVLRSLAGLAGTVLKFVLSIIIAGVLLSTAQKGKDFSVMFATRLAGPQGADFVRLSVATIRSVAQGVIGIALIQSALSGIGLLVVGVPGAMIWALIVLVLAIMQLPPILVLGPAMVYVFAHSSTVTAVIFLVYGLVVSGSDSFLKPMLLGRGVDVPMLVILLGAIGGMIVSGIIGLFVGAVILALAYQLMMAWLTQDADLGLKSESQITVPPELDE
jgi:predicted PurR-regulated permease PerM